MIIRKLPVKFKGSCNFCERSYMDNSTMTLKYPYDYIYSIKGEDSGPNVRFCEECLDEIKAIS